MALRAREEDENGIEWGSDWQAKVGFGWYSSPNKKLIWVCPEEKNVATRYRDEHAEELCPFSHTSRRS
jgi:hypothetical protein